jgi:hypothetical protein
MPADPFMDDHVAPTPTPAADARARSLNKAKMTTFPKAAPARALKPVPMKTASRNKVASKTTGKSVLKVAYDEESSIDEDDAPPAAPASIRSLKASEEPARFAVKPVVHVQKAEPANPLRP